MKYISSFIGTLSIISLSLIFAATPSLATSEKQCICHNVQNNPVEVCSDDDSYKEGHENHLESGFDTYGACPAQPSPSISPTPGDGQPPIVPEFGLITGLAAVAISTGSYLKLKGKI